MPVIPNFSAKVIRVSQKGSGPNGVWPLFFFALLGCLLLGGRGVCADPAAYLSELQSAARREKLAERPEWRRLLHVRRSLTGRVESEIDGPDFFLAPEGRRNPDAELSKTLEAFFEPLPAEDQAEHPQCRYPARYAWLKKELQFNSARLPEQYCSRYQAWKGSMDAGSVSMIYASSYMSNPASIYGHTFLRLNRRGRALAPTPLLDYTVNFAADVNTSNGMLFAVKGLTGGYRGKFSTMPYYAKVQQYSNMESRDLWEYDLALSSAAVDRLAAHLWELGHTSMAYFFFNKNCSYQLLPPMEAAEPSLDLSRGFVFKAVPMDTVRILTRQPGFVTAVRMRPSLYRRMVGGRRALSDSEQKITADLARRGDPEAFSQLETLGPERQAKVLEVANDYLRYRAGYKPDLPAEIREREQRIQLARSRLPAGAEPVILPGPTDHPPHESQRTGRVGLGFGFDRRTRFEELSIRSAAHDIEADPSGYLIGSGLEMFNLRLRFDNDRRKPYVERFTLVDLKSYTPWDSWVRLPSWQINTGLATAHDLDRAPDASLYYGLNLGSGFSFESRWIGRELFYALAEADGGAGGVFDDHYRLGGGGRAGALLHLTDWWRMHALAQYLNYPAGRSPSFNRLSLIQSFSLRKNLELRCALERSNHYREAFLSLLFYL